MVFLTLTYQETTQFIVWLFKIFQLKNKAPLKTIGCLIIIPDFVLKFYKNSLMLYIFLNSVKTLRDKLVYLRCKKM